MQAIVLAIVGIAITAGVYGVVALTVKADDFGLRLALAPHKLRYVRHNWLTAISLVLPALRIFRIFRII